MEIAAARGKSSSGMVASFGLLEANEIKTYREIVRVSNSEETDVNTYRESLDAVLPESLDNDERRKWIAAFTKVFQSRLLKGGEESD